MTPHTTMKYKIHITSFYRKIDLWQESDTPAQTRDIIARAKIEYLPQLDPTDQLIIHTFETAGDRLRLVDSDITEPQDTERPRRTCRNCLTYWGCRTTDNPRLDDDPNGRPCARWRAKIK